jgi:acyl-CoA reductase-like NAD-dependent aldehyde dehydrogenase
MKLVSTNPAKNYQKIGEVGVTSDEEIVRKVDRANKAKDEWRKIGATKRVELLRNAYNLLKYRADDIALSITKEIGTSISESKDEVNWDWEYFLWFLDNVEKALAPETTHEDDSLIYQVVYEPIGSVAVITPWNLPFDMFVWGVIPNLLAGNTVIYKAAEECVLTGKLLEEIMNSAGLPEGVFSAVHGGSEQGSILAQQNIDMIWFTGSSEVGKKLYELAGKKLIKCVLEMGGSNPAIVFEDADLKKVVSTIKFKRYSFSGQTCDAVKRLIVHEDIFNELVDLLKAEVTSITVGDPEDEATDMGSLVSKKQLDALMAQVNHSLGEGARVLTGGKQPDNLQGAYYLPAILTNVSPAMRVWKEEVFGPVLPIVVFSTEEEAIRLANDTRYGLGAQVYTANNAKALRVAAELKAGGVDINGVNRFKPFNPFGGYKDSGMGREHGMHGFRELCQIKLLSQMK